jgi:hypothetical protein
VAGKIQRDVQQRAAACGDLFAAKPFDAALFSTFSLAIAFSAPWLDADRLRMASRACIWCLGLDWQVDYVSTSRAEVSGLVEHCLAVAGGETPAPDDGLGGFLADIRDELAELDGFAALRAVWLDEVRRLLRGMATEREWKSAEVRPTLEEYLSNADNLGFSFVYISHLIYTTEPAPLRDLDELLGAGRAVQQVIRLLNDLATYDRDVAWGDLNAIMLVPDPDDVRRRLAVLTRLAHDLIDPIRDRHPQVAAYLERQMGFCTGFYGLSDFWGRL